MEIKKAYCLFEQSGTFKKEFLARGIEAEDFDILNDFGQTDQIIDLFGEIEKAYDGNPSIFDKITKDDIILAFFPCTRFESNITMAFRGQQYQLKDKPDLYKVEYALELHKELHHLYELIAKLFCVVLRGGVEDDCRESKHSTTLFDKLLPDKT